MKAVFLIVLCSHMVFAQELTSVDIIQDPSVSKRCKRLIKSRNDKVEVGQKLRALIRRNEKLQLKLRESQKIVLQKLQISSQNVQRKITENKIHIKDMEEYIIRSGCPGIEL